MKKKYITMLMLTFVICSYSQENTFIRVFNSGGLKIGKGGLLSTTDSTLVLSGKTTFEIRYNKIGYIKTKHTLGHNILTGSILIGVIGTLIGLIGKGSGAISSTSTGSAVAIGLALGGTAGAAMGALTSGLKDTDTFFVNGHFAEWQKVKLQMDKILVKQVKYEPSLW